jgi:hypothetical protein
MSMHKIPLTELERAGLKAHGLDIGKPSQLSDCFRSGIKFAQSRHDAEREALVRQCAEIVAEHETDWDFAYDDILALLYSGSQG